MMPEGCPTAEALQALLSGDLPLATEGALAEHLSSCADCQRSLAEMAGGRETFPTVRLDLPILKSERLLQVMERLKTDPLHPTPSASGSPFTSGTPPRLFGDYEILGELGRGGVGVVYRARQLSLNRPVALKLVLAGQLASAAEVRRFRTETEAAARLEHSNIVPIYEVGDCEGRQFFSMRLVEGMSLAEAISDWNLREARQAAEPANPKTQQDSPEDTRLAFLPTNSPAQLVAIIARAVHYAHQRGVLHRDIKPANILIDTHGQPHLTDFGLAKLLENQSSLTHSGAVMGTPSYMAPEAAAGRAKEVTTATDVYSLGAVLYELLAGRPPFIGDSPISVLRKVLEEEPTPPSLAIRQRTAERRSDQTGTVDHPSTLDRPRVDRDLETICLKCLEKEPVRRYSSAEALAEDLERFQRGEPIVARPSASWERCLKWARRQPALAAALAACLVLFVGGLTGVLWKWRGELAQRLRAEDASSKAQRAAFRLELERAEMLLESGESSKGLALLARRLRLAPTNSVVAERLLSALSHRTFCLPIAPWQHDSPLSPNRSNNSPPVQNSFLSIIDGSALAANFNADGSLVVTAGKDGAARLWDAQSGRALAAPLRHSAPISWADFSADARRVVTASLDQTAQVWDVVTAKPIGPALRHPDLVWHAAFSPDGQFVVTASQDRHARIWRVDSAESPLVLEEQESPVCFAAFSPDGRRIVTAQREGPAHLWDRRTGRWIAQADHGYHREVGRPFPVFSPRGNELLTFWDRQAIVWSGPAFQSEPISFSHNDLVLELAWSPDAKLAAVASQDGTAQVWDRQTRLRVSRPLPHGHAVLSVQFSDDGRTLLTGSRDRTARLWNVDTGREWTEALRHDSAVVSARLAPGNRRAVTVSQAGPSWLWEIRPPATLALILHHSTTVSRARFSFDGRRVISASSTKAFLWDADTGQSLGRALDHFDAVRGLNVEQEIYDIDVSPMDGRVVTASEDGNIFVRDGLTGETLEPRLANYSQDRGPIRRRDAVTMIRFSPDGSQLVTAGENAKLWDIRSGRMLRALRHSAAVNCVQFSRDGRKIVTASADQTAVVWDANTGQPLTPPLRHDDDVFWAAFDPAGERVATASRDKTVRIWSTRDGQMVLPQPLRHPDPLSERHSVEFSPGGTLLLSAAGSVGQLWHASTGQPAAPALHHRALVSSIRFNRAGTRIVTACSDGTARIWDPLTGHQLSEPLRHGDRVDSAEFSPDGTRVLTCSADSTARLWPVLEAPTPVPVWLPELAEALAGQRLDENEVSQPVAVNTLFRLRQELSLLAPTDRYTRWVQWFLAEPSRRERWPR